MNFMTILLDPFAYEFFVKGLIVATLAGALCGLIGVFIVLRGMSYIGHGISHSIFGGFAASSIIGFNFYLGAGIWGIASALAIAAVTRKKLVGADAAIGVITMGSFALGVALLTYFGNKGPTFDAALFGSILGVRWSDVYVIVGVLGLALGMTFFFYRSLLFTTFDAEVAATAGVNVVRIESMLMIVLSLSTLVTLNVIGVTLVAATLVIPPVIGRLLTDSFHRLLGISTALGASFGFLGMNLSYHLDVPSGTTIVLIGAIVFTMVYLFKSVRPSRMPKVTF